MRGRGSQAAGGLEHHLQRGALRAIGRHALRGHLAHRLVGEHALDLLTQRGHGLERQPGLGGLLQQRERLLAGGHQLRHHHLHGVLKAHEGQQHAEARGGVLGERVPQQGQGGAVVLLLQGARQLGVEVPGQPPGPASRCSAEVVMRRETPWQPDSLKERGASGGRAGVYRQGPPAGASRDYSSRDISRRSLPDFLDTTVATVVKPALR